MDNTIPAVPKGCVVGRILHSTVDGPDAGVEPDTAVNVGTVTFTPATAYRKLSADTVLTHSAMIANLDSHGHLHPLRAISDNTGSDAEDAIWLPVGTWAVTYRLNTGALPTHNIAVTEAHTAEAPLALFANLGDAPASGATYVQLTVPVGGQEGQVLVMADGSLAWATPAAGGAVSAASTTVAGIAELATTAETVAGTDTSRAVTPAGVAAAIDAAGSGAYPVQQVTLTADLAYTLPVGAPTDQVVGVVFTQDSTGGHTVTYGGSPLTVTSDAGASTLVEFFHDGTDWEARVLTTTTPPDLSGYVPTSRTVNGQALTGDITLDAADVGALPDTYTPDMSGLLATSAAPELIRDTMSAALVAGANVTITPDDAGDTITIAAAASGGSGSLDMGSMFMPCPVGKYLPYFAAGVANASLNIANSTANSALFMRVCPVFAKGAYTYDLVSFGLATPATDAGSLIRIALYTADGAFVKELGTVDATSAAGTKSIVISESLAAGVHLLAMRFQSPTTAGTNPLFYGYTGAVGEITNSTPGDPAVQYKYLSHSATPLTSWPTQHPNDYNNPLPATAASPQISLRRQA